MDTEMAKKHAKQQQQAVCVSSHSEDMPGMTLTVDLGGHGAYC